MYFGNVYSGFFLGLPRPRFGVPASTDAGCTFFGLPGRRFGVVSTGFSFLGLPGLLFGCSMAVAIEPFEESVVAVVPERFSFLGRPRLGFIAVLCSCGVAEIASNFAFGLPLFTNVKSGFTW